jgi:hypothetical protein
VVGCVVGGLVVGVVVVPPVHATPLREKVVGVGLAEPNVPVNPTPTVPPAATDPFQLTLAAVTDWPDCVQVALHPWLTFWLASGKVNPSVQAVSGSPRLVMVIEAWKPPGHWLGTV